MLQSVSRSYSAPPSRFPSATAVAPPVAEPAGLDDRARLDLRLDMYGLSERTVQGDGNCQFRALADQLLGSEELHGTIRACVVNQLRAHSELYVEYCDEPFDSYCNDMALPGTWGDHLTLQAAADYYQLRIAVVASFPGAAFLEITPRTPLRSSRVLWLSFWAEVHYNSVYAKGEVPPQPSRLLRPGWVEAEAARLRKGPKLLGSRKLYKLLSW